MDPLTLAIVSAISAGAAAGLAKTGETVVTDAYQALKDLLKRRLGADNKVVEAAVKLEEDPESAGWRESLAKEIGKAGAHGDAELVAAARALLDKIEQMPGGEQNIQTIAGDYNAQADRGGTATVNVYRVDK